MTSPSDRPPCKWALRDDGARLCDDGGFCFCYADSPGTDPHKLHSRDDTPTSIDAAHQVDTTKGEKACLNLIKRAGPKGITNKEMMPAMGKDMSKFSGRVTSLLNKGLVCALRDEEGELVKRDKCRVVIAIEYKPLFQEVDPPPKRGPRHEPGKEFDDGNKE